MLVVGFCGPESWFSKLAEQALASESDVSCSLAPEDLRNRGYTCVPMWASRCRFCVGSSPDVSASGVNANILDLSHVNVFGLSTGSSSANEIAIE